jgi:flavin reductase (DIM6/NTAB) family NADH-FMN oxidoreductase RutF
MPVKFRMSGPMPLFRNVRKLIRDIVLGKTLIPQEFTVGLVHPQTEITVWLHGMGAPVDVTCRHSTACSAPFVICIAFDEGRTPNDQEIRRLSLKYCERSGQKRLLGEIGLKLATSSSVSGVKLFFFEARSSGNYCLPRIRLYAHYLLEAYSSRRRVNTSGVEMSFLERRAAMVTFIRPHPVFLGSINDERGGNIFPMNIMGELGNGLIGFGLKDSRMPAHLIERTGRFALSSVPVAQSPLVFQLAANHFKESIEWDQLTFPTKESATFGIPVPGFALRVREMEVEKIYKIGSHTFFVAKIISDEVFGNGEELCAIHGFYQAWRLKGQSAALRESVAQDCFHKQKQSSS